MQGCFLLFLYLLVVPYKDVLKFLSKSEIAVVPSRWEEPFGRTALESSSRACATIIFNRGGLPETSDHCLILKIQDNLTHFHSLLFLKESDYFRHFYFI